MLYFTREGPKKCVSIAIHGNLILWKNGCHANLKSKFIFLCEYIDKNLKKNYETLNFTRHS